MGGGGVSGGQATGAAPPHAHRTAVDTHAAFHLDEPPTLRPRDPQLIVPLRPPSHGALAQLEGQALGGHAGGRGGVEGTLTPSAALDTAPGPPPPGPAVPRSWLPQVHGSLSLSLRSAAEPSLCPAVSPAQNTLPTPALPLGPGVNATLPQPTLCVPTRWPAGCPLSLGTPCQGGLFPRPVWGPHHTPELSPELSAYASRGLRNNGRPRATTGTELTRK